MSIPQRFGVFCHNLKTGLALNPPGVRVCIVAVIAVTTTGDKAPELQRSSLPRSERHITLLPFLLAHHRSNNPFTPTKPNALILSRYLLSNLYCFHRTCHGHPTQAKYRGVSYSLHSESEISAPPAVTLQYRGVCYSLNPEVGQPETAVQSIPLQPALA